MLSANAVESLRRQRNGMASQRRGNLRAEAFLAALSRVLIRAGASPAVIAGVCAAARDLREGGRA